MSHTLFDIIMSTKSVILSFTLAGEGVRGAAAPTCPPALGMPMVTSGYFLDSVFYGQTFVGQPESSGSTNIWKELENTTP